MTIARATTFGSMLLAGLLAAAAPPARAVPVPGPLAEADATAHYQDYAVPSALVISHRFADQLAIAAGPGPGNFAISDGTGIVSDPLFGASVDGFAEIQGTASYPGP